MKILATPDTVILEPLDDDSLIVTGESEKGRILKGRVLALGYSLPTPSGEYIKPPFQVGDTAYFLSYEGDYDNRKIEGKVYYFVKFQDVRGFEKEMQ